MHRITDLFVASGVFFQNKDYNTFYSLNIILKIVKYCDTSIKIVYDNDMGLRGDVR